MAVQAPQANSRQQLANQNFKTVNNLLSQYKSQFEAALPKHLPVERLLRVALSELRRTPKLMDCDPLSFVGSIMLCAQLGLEPGGALGHVYLIPFKDQVNVVIGYRGMIALARNSGQIISLSAHEVFEKDEFHYELGLKENLIHKPLLSGDRGQLIGVYSVAHLVGGGHQICVMSKDDIEKIRKKSSNSNSKPWHEHYGEMAKKSCIRRLFKYLPVSIEIQTATVVDEASEGGRFDAKSMLMDSVGSDEMIDMNTGEVIQGEIENKSQADELAESI